LNMAKDRADLGFASILDDFDPAEWIPEARAQLKRVEPMNRKVAEASGFKSREAGKLENEAVRPPLRRRRTGRNAQFNLKARPETIEAFCAIADQQDWGLGETLEYAVKLLEREYGKREERG